MNLKNIFLFIFFLFTILEAQEQFNSIASQPGSFSRMGFAARGKSMGNALGAVVNGNVDVYYNPALSVYQDRNSFHTAYSFLSLDRKLNFLSFTKKFELGKSDSLRKNKFKPTAGLAIGLINSGVSNIDERDNQGFKTNSLSVFENQFFLNLALKISNKISFGLNAKFYYSKIYKDITSTTLGFDVGAIYKFSENFYSAIVIKDINSKYKWDSSKLYGLDGVTIEEKFPVLKKFSASYNFSEINLLVAAEVESSSFGTNIFRLGTEYSIINNLRFRGGIDYINLSNSDTPIRPAFGLEYKYTLSVFDFSFQYAFAFEPYSEFDQHIIGISINF